MSIKYKFKVERIRPTQYREWILYKHYAKRLPSISYSFGLFESKILQGVCTFGLPASPNVSKGICGETHSKYVIELNRLIINEGLDKNCLSFFVSQCIKILPKPKIIVSYSDSSLHNGYIYQALNFLYTGIGNPRTHIAGINGKHPRHYVEDFNDRVEWTPKHRYILFIGNKRFKSNMLNSLKYKIEDYPKGQNKKYDTSYKPIIQQLIF